MSGHNLHPLLRSRKESKESGCKYESEGSHLGTSGHCDRTECDRTDGLSHPSSACTSGTELHSVGVEAQQQLLAGCDLQNGPQQWKFIRGQLTGLTETMNMLSAHIEELYKALEVQRQTHEMDKEHLRREMFTLMDETRNEAKQDHEVQHKCCTDHGKDCLFKTEACVQMITCERIARGQDRESFIKIVEQERTSRERDKINFAMEILDLRNQPAPSQHLISRVNTCQQHLAEIEKLITTTGPASSEGTQVPTEPASLVGSSITTTSALSPGAARTPGSTGRSRIVGRVIAVVPAITTVSGGYASPSSPVFQHLGIVPHRGQSPSPYASPERSPAGERERQRSSQQVVVVNQYPSPSNPLQLLPLSSRSSFNAPLSPAHRAFKASMLESPPCSASFQEESRAIGSGLVGSPARARSVSCSVSEASSRTHVQSIEAKVLSPRKGTHQFRVGDRVRGKIHGRTGTVLAVDANGNPEIKLDGEPQAQEVNAVGFEMEPVGGSKNQVFNTG